MALTPQDVRRLGALARIELTDEELDRLAPQLDVILEAVASVTEVAADDIPPTSHALPLTARFFALYRSDPTGWTLVDVANDMQASFGPLAAGTWAISAVNRGGAESQGVVTVIR